MLQIDDDPGLVALGEGVAMEAGALGRGELGADLGIRQHDGVVAGLHDLTGVLKA